MTCQDIAPDLVAYHFAEIDADARERVEAHLAGCPACVAAFIALKRAVEIDAAPAPSAGARARLRRAVAEELGVAPAVRRAWERPLAFALAACTVLALGAATRAATAGPGAPPYALSHNSP